MSKEEFNPGRRSLLNWLLGTSLVGLMTSIVYPIVRFLSVPDVPEAATNQVEAGATNDPELIDRGFKIVRFGVEPILLIRVADDDFRAFAATCTHLDCIVEYQKEEQRIWCNCHNGEYDLTGRNVGGPPPKPLAPYEVNLVPKPDSQAKSIVISKA